MARPKRRLKVQMPKSLQAPPQAHDWCGVTSGSFSSATPLHHNLTSGQTLHRLKHSLRLVLDRHPPITPITPCNRLPLRTPTTSCTLARPHSQPHCSPSPSQTHPAAPCGSQSRFLCTRAPQHLPAVRSRPKSTTHHQRSVFLSLRHHHGSAKRLALTSSCRKP